MLDKLMTLLRTPPAPGPDTVASPFDRTKVAVAALLVEASRADREVTHEEKQAIRRVICANYSLCGEIAEALLKAAEGEFEASLEDWVFTEAVRTGFDRAQREQVIEMLWEVVYADARLAALEEQLVERLAGQLDVPEAVADEIRGRVFARASLGTAPGEGSGED
ncbi:MAG: TerB family tellurite resistance protein [Rhodocyclaceae bacterium]